MQAAASFLSSVITTPPSWIARHHDLMNYTFHFHLPTPRLGAVPCEWLRGLGGAFPRYTQMCWPTLWLSCVLLPPTFNCQSPAPPHPCLLSIQGPATSRGFPRGNHTRAPFLPLTISIQANLVNTNREVGWSSETKAAWSQEGVSGSERDTMHELGASTPLMNWHPSPTNSEDPQQALGCLSSQWL